MKKSFLSFAAVLCALLCLSSIDAKAQTVKLFNGKNLSNWNLFVDKGGASAQEVFTVKEGTIHVKGTPFGYMYTKEKYSNFILNVEWCYPEELSNSGIFLFIQDGEKLWPNAIECQLHAGDAGDFVLLGGSDLFEFMSRPGTIRPAFPVVKKTNASSEKPVGEWNRAKIYCKDGKITVFINGVYQNSGTRSMHKTGYIGLQSEGKDIQFRNVTVTPL